MDKLLGAKTELSARTAIAEIETAICEGLLYSPSFAELNEEKTLNIYRRPVNTLASSDISFVKGLAANGLRAGAYINGKELVKNKIQLDDAVRQLLSLVIVAEVENHREYYAIANSNCFQLFASSPQEIVDFTLIAHRISELSLIPGVVAFEREIATDKNEIKILSKQNILEFLGNPDDNISSPTPAQQMIFGKNRRRIPDWFNFDNPVLSSADKDQKGLALESAAKQQYFQYHLEEIINSVFKEFGDLTERNYSQLNTHKLDDAEYVILTQGSIFSEVISVADELRLNKVAKTGTVNLSMFRPYPTEKLFKALAGKKVITVIEREIPSIFKEMLGTLKQEETKIFSGIYGATLSAVELTAAFENMYNIMLERPHFLLGLDFTKKSSAFPKHEILLQAIKREYPEAEYQSLNVSIKPSETEDTKQDKIKSELPFTIRRYQDQGPPYTSLSRFYNDTAGIYEEENELVADPFQGVPVMPPASANFARQSKREKLPAFIPEECTGCGECFVYCPHSAIPPIAIGIEGLIKAGVQIAAQSGKQITQLTPVVKNLSNAANKELKEKEDITLIADLLPDVFEKTVKQMKLQGDKLEIVKSEFEAVLQEIGNFRFTKTDFFFNQPDAQEKGTGELFSLAIDPNVCTSCGVCVEVCDDSALEMTEQTAEALEEVQSAFSLWEQLPDTSGETVTRMHHDPEYNPLAAILLSRNFYYSMTGGSTSEKGAPEKAMLHLVTATAESVIQPKIAERVVAIEELMETLSENIHQKLSEALPKENFEALSKVMDETHGKKQPFDEIVKQLGSREHLKLIDTNILQRKIELVNSLNNLKWVLTNGPSGTGRSRFGMAMAGQSGWSMQYPFNNLCGPVIMNLDGTVPEFTLGLVKGHIRHSLDNIKLIKRAELETNDKYDPVTHDTEIASLQWEDLNEEEKSLVPPILLVGSRKTLEEKNLTALLSLLSCQLPVKVCIFDNGLPAVGKNGSENIQKEATSLISAILIRKFFVLQSSTATPRHLLNGLLEGLQSHAPALFHIFAPDQEKHSIPGESWVKLPSLALNTRTFPFVKYNPDNESKYVCSGMDLSENPSEALDWHTEAFSYDENGKEQSLEYTLTWADWAHTLSDWESHFHPYEEEEGTPLEVAEYIALDSGSREGKVPVIIRSKEKEGLKKYVVSKEVTAVTESVLVSWDMLREIGGTITEFPEKLRKNVEAELNEKHQEELKQLTSEYEEKLKTLEQEQLEKIRIKIRDKLVALSQQGKIKIDERNSE